MKAGERLAFDEGLKRIERLLAMYMDEAAEELEDVSVAMSLADAEEAVSAARHKLAKTSQPEAVGAANHGGPNRSPDRWRA